MDYDINNINQMKSFMKREAKRLGISVNSCYTTFFARELARRLSKFNYDTIVVKGSFSQFVYLNELTRPILDIDLSSTCDFNYPLSMLFRCIYDSNSKNITYDLNKAPYTTNNGVIKVPVIAYLEFEDNMNPMVIPINIDFKSNNIVIFEKQYKKVNPIFEGDKPFYINTPSFEEHLAEKCYIVLRNNDTTKINTRVKDFYDIYKLYNEDYDKQKFSLYFHTMLLLYGLDPFEVDTKFLNSQYISSHTNIWNKMKVKYDFNDKSIEFNEVVNFARYFIEDELKKIMIGDNYVDALNLCSLIKDKQQPSQFILK